VSARVTRRQAIAAAGVPVVLASVPGAALAATSDEQQKRARAALSSALQLEQIAVVAYEAIANGGRLSARATALFRQLLDDDRQHAAQLLSALESLGEKPPIPPRRAKIPGLDRVRGDGAAAAFGIALEERTVGAYSSAVRYLADANELRTVVGAMGTDGQHLVVLRQLARLDPVPRAFERGTHP
jgi:hypothetical protein